LWKRAGGSSFFEEPNKIERKSPSLLHDPQAASTRARETEQSPALFQSGEHERRFNSYL